MNREEAIDGVKKIKNYLCAGNPMWDTTTISEVLDMAISALEFQERKTGKWSVEFSPAYMGGAYCECSQCNYKFAMGAYFEPDEWKFCPYCGAEMRGEQDE